MVYMRGSNDDSDRGNAGANDGLGVERHSVTQVSSGCWSTMRSRVHKR